MVWEREGWESSSGMWAYDQPPERPLAPWAQAVCGMYHNREGSIISDEHNTSSPPAMAATESVGTRGVFMLPEHQARTQINFAEKVTFLWRGAGHGPAIITDLTALIVSFSVSLNYFRQKAKCHGPNGHPPCSVSTIRSPEAISYLLNQLARNLF